MEAFDRGFINQEFGIKSRVTFQRSLLRPSLRTLSSQDGKAEEDVNWIKKTNSYFWLEFLEWLDAFTISYVATPQLTLNACEHGWVQNGNISDLPSEFLFLRHTNFGDFEVLLCVRVAVVVVCLSSLLLGTFCSYTATPKKTCTLI